MEVWVGTWSLGEKLVDSSVSTYIEPMRASMLFYLCFTSLVIAFTPKDYVTRIS
jgi:hypothetical protein